MYPAVTPASGLPDGFDTLIVPETSLLLSAEDAAKLRPGALDAWRAALAR
jgi:thiamine transport system substrate-binding protein